jgi:hypothetical protein
MGRLSKSGTWVFGFVVLLLPTSSADFPTEYEIVLEDDGDAVPFFDVVSVGVAADESNLYLRGEITAVPPDPAFTVFYFGFTADGPEVVSGYSYEGEITTRNIGEPIEPAECIVEGTVGICRYPLKSISASLGGPLSNIWAFTDINVPGVVSFPGDTAPGVNLENWPAANGAAWTITTAAGGAPVGDGNGTGEVIERTIDDAEFQIAHGFTEATNDTYRYNWTAAVTDVNVTVTATVTGGEAAIRILDANGTVVLERDIAADADETLNAADAVAGNWTIEIVYSGFVGELTVAIVAATDDGSQPHPSASFAPTTAAPATASNPFALEEEGNRLPGPAFLVVLTALAAVVIARRRVK